MKQLNQEQAIAFYNSKVWEIWTFEQKVRFQLFQNRLCIPFNKFHEAIESVLGRSVFMHEFADRDRITQEYLGTKQAPTFEEIIEMIPQEKRLILQS